MRAGSGLSLSPEFDDFLSATVGEERNGRLSVISMLGRLDIDPWQEASKLAILPRKAAIHRLALLIESLPDRMISASDPNAIATRLLTKLPIRKMTLAPPIIPLAAAGRSLSAFPWLAILGVASAIALGIILFS